MSGSTLRVNSNADGPNGDLTIGYEIVGRQSVWFLVGDDCWTPIITNARCSVQNSVVVRIQEPVTEAVSGDTWLLAMAREGRANRNLGDHVFPNSNHCFIAGAMSWCGTATNDAGQTVAPNGQICGVEVTCRRQ